MRLVGAATILATCLALLGASAGAGPAAADPGRGVRTIRFVYRTHRGDESYALLLLPKWYGPKRHPALPIVICPHGRNTTPEAAAKRWYDLPTLGKFAVVLPAGQGRVLQLYSWGYPGQIDDLARMPKLAERAVPYFRYVPGRVYAVGASMGGQEALLLEAKRPHLLAGTIAFDPAVNLANRYHELSDIPFGRWAQAKARIEVGGTPSQVPKKYKLRSPTHSARQIAFAGVPTQLWWSTHDQVIINQAKQTGRFFDRLKQLNPDAPIDSYVGHWHHATEDSAFAVLPIALAKIGLLPSTWLSNDPLATTHTRPKAFAYTPQVVKLPETVAEASGSA